MKICFVITQLGGGGAERVASILCNYFVSKGANVSIVCTSIFQHSEYEIDKKISVYRISKNRQSIFQKAKKLREIILQEKPDVCISFLPNTDLIIWLSGIGSRTILISSERNSPKDYPKQLYLRILRLLGFLRADAVVFQSEGAKAFFSKRIQDKGIVIPNPICFNRLPTASSSIKRIVAVGRISPQKNYDLLVRSFSIFHKNHEDYTLQIFGKDYSNGKLNSLICELGLSRSVSRKDFSDCVWSDIAKSSFFCLSSDFEGIPNSLLEAVAIGIPVISTDCRPGGARPLINGKNGLLVPVGNPLEYSSAMCKVADNLDSFKKGALEFRCEIKKKFDVETIGDRWLALFQALLDVKRK